MSGLAGVISLRAPLDAGEAESLVETMARAQEHRSRSGWRVVVRERVAYASDAVQGEAADPGPTGLVVTLDGVITNREQLDRDLETAGVASNGADGAGALGRAWSAWGYHCLERLDGRFAALVRDGGTGASFLARDPFGHRPLHYAVRGDRLFFASEVKTLLPVLPPAEPDQFALMEWTLYGDVLAPRTLFRGIRSLPPGHVLEVSGDGVVGEPRAYFDPADVVDRTLFEEYSKRSIPNVMTLVESTVDHAVRRHMGGRANVAVMLSGGVDSTMIAALARRHADIRGYNFSIAGNATLDERPTANLVAQRLGIPIQSVPIDGDTYRRELAATTYEYEMPLWHMQAVPIHLLARQARKDGVGLLLSGVCIGPFLSAAAGRYRWVLPPAALDRVPAAVLRLGQKAIYSASGLPMANPAFTKTLSMALKLIDVGARATLLARHDDVYGFLEDDRERRIQVMRLTDNALFERRFFHQGDRLCMAQAVEYADAAVDREFQRLAFNLSSRVIYRKRQWKWVLKELASRYVPREVAFQKKIPLDVPIDEYFAPQFRRSLFADGFLASLVGLGWDAAVAMVASAGDRAAVLLRLVNIETWGRLFFMGQSVEEVTSTLVGDAEPANAKRRHRRTLTG